MKIAVKAYCLDEYVDAPDCAVVDVDGNYISRLNEKIQYIRSRDDISSARYFYDESVTFYTIEDENHILNDTEDPYVVIKNLDGLKEYDAAEHYYLEIWAVGVVRYVAYLWDTDVMFCTHDIEPDMIEELIEENQNEEKNSN